MQRGVAFAFGDRVHAGADVLFALSVRVRGFTQDVEPSGRQSGELTAPGTSILQPHILLPRTVHARGSDNVAAVTQYIDSSPKNLPCGILLHPHLGVAEEEMAAAT